MLKSTCLKTGHFTLSRKNYNQALTITGNNFASYCKVQVWDNGMSVNVQAGGRLKTKNRDELD